MAELLGPDECLLRDGMTDLRARDGSPLQNVPVYRIVRRCEADPAAIEQLEADESLVLQGHVAYRQPDGRFGGGVNLYRKVQKTELSPKTGMLPCDEDNCNALVMGMVAQFGEYVERVKALEHQQAQAAKRSREGTNPNKGAALR